MYVPEFFRVEEIIPPADYLPRQMRNTYNRDPQSLFRCFPAEFLATLDALRRRYGPATVNNWFWMDPASLDEPHCRKWSGYRPESCAIGADLSEHRFFRAGDLIFQRVVPAEIWADMVADPNRAAFRHIQRIEAYHGMGWFHFDLGHHARYDAAVRVFTVTDNRAGLPEFINR